MSDTDRSHERRRIGADVLGPIFAWYLHELHARLLVTSRQEIPSLFVARAGVRLDEMYRRFCTSLAIEPATGRSVFWTSRMLLTKGLLTDHESPSFGLVNRTFEDQTVGDVTRALLRHEPDLLTSIQVEGAPFDRPAAEFASALGNPRLAVLTEYFERYRVMIDAQFEHCGVSAGGAVVLVDSGWQGTIHRLVEEFLPDIDVTSLYFGVGELDDGATLPADVVGLITRVDGYDRTRPESALTFYRHLIEGVLEPTAESAESLVDDSSGVRCPQSSPDDPEGRDGPADQLYLGVLDHLDNIAGLRPWALACNYERAVERLDRMITHPVDEDEVSYLSVASRSGDFGTDLSVTIPMSTEKRHEFDTAALRISDSLWPQAQAIAELPSDEVEPTLRALTGGGAAAYFTPLDQSDRAGTAGLVQIVTRTKDRNTLLRRAAESVASQTYGNYEWVVVNDGGDAAAVLHTLRSSPADLSRTTLVSNESSVGMEAASNLGVRATDAEFVVIHDDDDSWDPSFLSECVEFLNSTPGQRYGGVITGSTKIYERIDGDEVEIVDSEPYNAWVTSIEIAQMLTGNLFAPIAFVYRRSEFDRCGGYDETLPVLGDWDYNLRFLENADIAVIPTPLANYHHRVEGSSVAYSNSVTGGRSVHVEYHAVLLNRYLRQGLVDDRSSLAYMGAMFGRLRDEIRQGIPIAGAAGSVGGSSDELAWAADSRWLALSWLFTSKESPLAPELKIDPGDAGGIERAIARLTDGALGNEEFLRRIPAPNDFDQQSYLIDNPDVKDAVAAKSFTSGYEHYIRFGRTEDRVRPT